MKKEHAAIIARARRDGLKPVELASELMGYTLIEAMRDASASQSVAFSKMSEVQQDSCIQQWTAATKEAIDLAIQVIASAGTRTVRMDLTSVAVGKKLKVAGVVAGTEEYKHDLIDLANDQGTAIVILNERDYLQGLDGIHGEKDQKALALDSSELVASKPTKKSSDKPKAASAIAKEIVLAPKLIEQAREFVVGQQNTTLAGMQNQFKVGADKARAVFAALVESGDVVAGEGLDKWELVRKEAEVNDAGDSAEVGKMTVNLYEAIKASVIKRNAVSAGVIMIEHEVSEEIALAAIDQLEDEGVVNEEDEIGGRSVNAAEPA